MGTARQAGGTGRAGTGSGGGTAQQAGGTGWAGTGSGAGAAVRDRSASHIHCHPLQRRVQDFTYSSRPALVCEREELSSRFLYHVCIVQPIN